MPDPTIHLANTSDKLITTDSGTRNTGQVYLCWMHKYPAACPLCHGRMPPATLQHAAPVHSMLACLVGVLLLLQLEEVNDLLMLTSQLNVAGGQVLQVLLLLVSQVTQLLGWVTSPNLTRWHLSIFLNIGSSCNDGVRTNLQ